MTQALITALLLPKQLHVTCGKHSSLSTRQQYHLPRWRTVRTRSHLCLGMHAAEFCDGSCKFYDTTAVAHTSALNSSRSNFLSSLRLRTKLKQGHCLLQAAWPSSERKQAQSTALHRLWFWLLLACVFGAAAPAAPSGICEITFRKRHPKTDRYHRCANASTA